MEVNKSMSLLKVLVFCSQWMFCITFEFLNYCIKILFTVITDFGTPLEDYT